MHDTNGFSNIQIYFLLIMCLILCLFKFFLSGFGSEKVRSHWSHLELMVITVVTQIRGEPSATSRLVSPTQRELRPKARSELREFRLIFEPAQFPSSSTTRAQQECKVKRSGKLRANEVKVRCKRRKGSIICIHFQIIS